jgi:hypothetical protein
VVRVVTAVLLTALSAVASAIFLIVLITKLTVLDDDGTARTGLVFWLAFAVLLTLGARAAWRRE